MIGEGWQAWPQWNTPSFLSRSPCIYSLTNYITQFSDIIVYRSEVNTPALYIGKWYVDWCFSIIARTDGFQTVCFSQCENSQKKNLWKKVKALLWWLWLADLSYTQGLTRVNINPMSWSWADNSMIYKNIIAPELPSMQPVKFSDITVTEHITFSWETH